MITAASPRKWLIAERDSTMSRNGKTLTGQFTNPSQDRALAKMLLRRAETADPKDAERMRELARDLNSLAAVKEYLNERKPATSS